MNIPELLCPAGNLDSFKAAINNGADAVYCGGRDFNARAGAANFSEAELLTAIDYAHLRGAKVNITINTLYKDNELSRVLNFAKKLYEYGADAFIIQDAGLFSVLRRYMPHIRLHASTQMTAHSLEGAIFLKELGFDRVVLSRELSIGEIENIAQNSGVEIEVFAHGALCVSYSGQCLMSSMIGGRSGNRGKCAQACRQHYKLFRNSSEIHRGFLLSPSDLMTLDNLKEIADTGISTLKIEGRMKDKEYVAVVTSAYRQALDALKTGESYEPDFSVKDVTQIFNRGGSFTSGYYYNYAGKTMMSTETPKSTGVFLGIVISVSKNAERDGKRKCLIKIQNDVHPGDGVEIWTHSAENTGGYINEKAQAGAIVAVYAAGVVTAGDKVYKSFDKELHSRAKLKAELDARKLYVEGSISITKDSPMEITLKMGGVTVSSTAEAAERSITNPTSKQRIIEQLSKTGGTPFIINFNNIQIDDGLFVPISTLNKLRRDAISEFSDKYAQSFRRDEQISICFPQTKPDAGLEHVTWDIISVQVCNKGQLQAALESGVKRINYTMSGYSGNDIKSIAKEHGDEISIYAALPKIMRGSDSNELKTLSAELEETSIRGYVVSTWGQLQLLKTLTKKEIVADYNFNILNNTSYNYIKESGAHIITISPEATIEEIKLIDGGEAIIYGRLPLMETLQCPIGLYVGGKDSGKYCKYKNNSAGYYLADRMSAEFGIFTDCSSCIALVLNGPPINMKEKLHIFQGTKLNSLRLLFYTENYAECLSVLRDFQLAINGEPTEPLENFTYGHYFRGVE